MNHDENEAGRAEMPLATLLARLSWVAHWAAVVGGGVLVGVKGGDLRGVWRGSCAMCNGDCLICC